MPDECKRRMGWMNSLCGSPGEDERSEGLKKRQSRRRCRWRLINEGIGIN
jgi:hypothetical protein